MEGLGLEGGLRIVRGGGSIEEEIGNDGTRKLHMPEGEIGMIVGFH